MFGVTLSIAVGGRCAGADGGLRLVQDVLPGVAGSRPDPEVYQAACVEAWAASQVARNFTPATVDKATGTLERILELCGRPAWEVTREDLDRVVGVFASAGLSASTRRGYVSVFKGLFGFLAARKQAEIQAWFGVRLADPVDGFNAARHVGNDSPGVAPPPTPERMDAFFGFLRERLATCRKFAPAGRDYALVRTLSTTPGCGRRRRSASMWATCISGGGRSASCTCATARRPGARDPGPAGCRCWTSWTWCCAGISTMCGPGSGTVGAVLRRGRRPHAQGQCP